MRGSECGEGECVVRKRVCGSLRERGKRQCDEKEGSEK